MPPKGKQGTRGAQQILTENQETIKFYNIVVFGSNSVYLLLRYLFFWDTFTTKFVTFYSIAAILQFISFYYLKSMATPIYDDEKKTLIDPGSDLNMKGHISEHLKDIILLPAIIYLVSLVTNYAWLGMLVIPAVAFYKLWVNILGPWFFAPAPEGDNVNEQNQKKVKQKTRIIRN